MEAAARPRRVLNFLLCEHKATGINSERRSSVRNRKNCGQNQIRLSRRLPRSWRMRTKRSRSRTKQRRMRRLAGGLPSGASPPLLAARRFLYLYLLPASDPLGPPSNAAHKRSLLPEEQEGLAHGRQNNFHHLLSTLQFPQERQGIFFN
jgi:hypothetical protein